MAVDQDEAYPTRQGLINLGNILARFRILCSSSPRCSRDLLVADCNSVMPFCNPAHLGYINRGAGALGDHLQSYRKPTIIVIINMKQYIERGRRVLRDSRPEPL